VNASQSSVQPWRKDVWSTGLTLRRKLTSPRRASGLSRNEQIADGIHELLTDAGFEPDRIDIVLDLYANIPTPIRIVSMNCGTPRPNAGAMSARWHWPGPYLQHGVSERQRDLWLATRMFFSFRIRSAVRSRQRAGVQSGFIFDLRDKSGLPITRSRRHALGHIGILTASPDVSIRKPFPVEGWNGIIIPGTPRNGPQSRQHPFASPSRAATEALETPDADSALASYRLISFTSSQKPAVAPQGRRIRPARLERTLPRWKMDVRHRGGSACGFLVAHLVDLKHRIAQQHRYLPRDSGISINMHALEPRPEEACRDHLFDLMRSIVAAARITVEPEGHMVADKRADISVTFHRSKYSAS